MAELRSESANDTYAYDNLLLDTAGTECLKGLQRWSTQTMWSRHARYLNTRSISKSNCWTAVQKTGNTSSSARTGPGIRVQEIFIPAGCEMRSRVESQPPS